MPKNRAPKPRAPLEKSEQRHIEELLTKLGAKVYHVGTHRRREDYQGTMQTPGIPDVLAFLPKPLLMPPGRLTPAHELIFARRATIVFIEAKRRGEKIKPGSAQDEFREFCAYADVLHWTGTLDNVIAGLIAGGWLSPGSVPHYRLPPELRP